MLICLHNIALKIPLIYILIYILINYIYKDLIYLEHPLQGSFKLTCFLFFFFYDIDKRRRYTKKVHPLKVLVGPSIVKRRIRGDSWAG